MNKLAASTLTCLLLLAGCADSTGPDARYACGNDPYVVVVDSERMAESDYRDLLRFRPAEREMMAQFSRKVGFFNPGERLRYLRAGDLDERHALVARHSDRFWTTMAEISCGADR